MRSGGTWHHREPPGATRGRSGLSGAEWRPGFPRLPDESGAERRARPPQDDYTIPDASASGSGYRAGDAPKARPAGDGSECRVIFPGSRGVNAWGLTYPRALVNFQGRALEAWNGFLSLFTCVVFSPMLVSLSIASLLPGTLTPVEPDIVNLAPDQPHQHRPRPQRAVLLHHEGPRLSCFGRIWKLRSTCDLLLSTSMPPLPCPCIPPMTRCHFSIISSRLVSYPCYPATTP